MSHLVDFDPGNPEVGPQPSIQECDCTDGKHYLYEEPTREQMQKWDDEYFAERDRLIRAHTHES